MTGHCRNPNCGERLWGGRLVPLCPSCRYIGARAFALGSFLAGVIAWALRSF